MSQAGLNVAGYELQVAHRVKFEVKIMYALLKQVGGSERGGLHLPHEVIPFAPSQDLMEAFSNPSCE